MKEEWIEINRKSKKPNTIVAVSNTGFIKRNDGSIDVSDIRKSILRFNGKLYRVHALIATLFIPKTEEDKKLGRNTVDHITHNPIGMNINDVRNLRWCTSKENANFPEALSNKQGKKKSPETCKRISDSHKGLTPWNKGKHNIYSEETLQKMRESHKNISEETRRKMSESHKGKPLGIKD